MKYENQVRRECAIFHSKKQDWHFTKSNSTNGIRLAVCITIAIAAFMLAACSDGSGTKSFRSSDEAIREYHGFLTALRQNDKVTIQSLAKVINEWRVLDDSVASCISHVTLSGRLTHTHLHYIVS